MEILNKSKSIPIQEFNGKDYYLYDGESYFSKGNKRLHRVVWEYYNGVIPKGYHIHHVDGDTYNNEISNLNMVKGSLHLRFTGKKRFKENEEWFNKFHSKGIEKAKEWHKSEQGKEWHSKQAKESYAKRIAIKKNCLECGKEYETKHMGRSKYCHNNCKAKYNRKKRKEKHSMTDNQRSKLKNH